MTSPQSLPKLPPMKLNFKLLLPQKKFLDSKAKETLMSGAWGSSKSFALGLAILREAIIPGSQILLCRKTFTALKRSTLKTLLFGENPILPRGSYVYNRVDQTITLNGLGSVIYMMGLDDIMKVRSMNLDFIAVDECAELSEMEWVELVGRLRGKLGSRRIVGATNPATPSHWLYKRFLSKAGKEHKNRMVIESTTLDNPHLPADYVESLKDMPEKLYNKYVLGHWVALDSAIYEFDRDIHVKHREHGEFVSYYLGVDFGFTNPSAITLIGIDGDDNLHLFEEQKESKLLISKIVDRAEKYHRLQPIVIVDPSAPALIAEFEQRGFNAKKADNSVDSGIARMQDMLDRVKFTVDDSCTEFMTEIENYIRLDDGRVAKVNDHILDAVRYVVNDIVGDKATYGRPLMITCDDDWLEEEDIGE